MNRTERRAAERAAGTKGIPISSTAVHEAGHVVVAWSLGFVVNSATIVPTAGYNGQVDWKFRETFRDSDGKEKAKVFLTRMLMKDCAGLEAEAICGFDISQRELGGWDREGVEMAFAKLRQGNPHITREMEHAMLQISAMLAFETLKANHGTVVMLARLLMQQKTLKSEEIASSCASAVQLPQRVTLLLRLMEEEGKLPTLDGARRLLEIC